MTDRESGERKPQDIGRASPASEEAKEQGERVEEEAHSGEPSGEHTRDGRRGMGGTRPGHRSDA